MVKSQDQAPKCCEPGCDRRARPTTYKSKLGFVRFRRRCRRCEIKKYGDGASKSYRRYKRDSCERCSFVPTIRAQLEVDHIDGNHSNNDPKNLQTLCANCHRLKTFRPDLL